MKYKNSLIKTTWLELIYINIGDEQKYVGVLDRRGPELSAVFSENTSAEVKFWRTQLAT